MTEVFSYGLFFSSLEDCIASTESGKKISVHLLLESGLSDSEKKVFADVVRRIGFSLQSASAGMATLLLGGSVYFSSVLEDSFCEFSLDRGKHSLRLYLSRLKLFRLRKDIAYVLRTLQRFFDNEVLIGFTLIIFPSLKEVSTLNYFDFLQKSNALSFQVSSSYYLEEACCWKEFPPQITDDMDGDIFGKVLVGISAVVFRKPQNILCIRLKEGSVWISFQEGNGNTRCVNLLAQASLAKWKSDEVFLLKQLIVQIFVFMIKHSGALEMMIKKNQRNPLVHFIKKAYAKLTGKTIDRKAAITFLPIHA